MDWIGWQYGNFQIWLRHIGFKTQFLVNFLNLKKVLLIVVLLKFLSKMLFKWFYLFYEDILIKLCL